MTEFISARAGSVHSVVNLGLRRRVSVPKGATSEIGAEIGDSRDVAFDITTQGIVSEENRGRTKTDRRAIGGQDAVNVTVELSRRGDLQDVSGEEILGANGLWIQAKNVGGSMSDKEGITNMDRAGGIITDR